MTRAPAEPATKTRDSRESYERYLRGMNASMRQKVALTAAHLLGAGRIADMGMGSGAGSDALAALYPRLEVVGVDLDETMVALARERFSRPNLSFRSGDIAAPLFEPASLDGIFDSSVLHHVTTFGGYDYARAAACLAQQVEALRPHGVLIVRDFLAPPDGDVTLTLSTTDGDASEDPRTCSSAQLFVRFSREFRSLTASPGFALVEVAAPRAGVRRFRTSYRLATEFVLRKDYRSDWEAEIREEYTYFSQADFESHFARLGLRVLASTPLRNPWIVRHRFVGKFDLRGDDGEPLLPATNYVIAGERVEDGEGVRFVEGKASEPLGFLHMSHFRDTRDGTVRDLVRRPHVSIDVVPYFGIAADLFVVARMSYPRPILASRDKAPALDESTPPHYVTEPLNVLQTDKPIGQTVEAMLAQHTAAKIRGFRRAGSYYPSPGGSQEEVRPLLVEIEPTYVEEHVPSTSGFHTSGRIRAIEAEQVLRAAQVGGLPDARLEVNVYDLFRELGRDPGPWIGETIAIDRPSRIHHAADLRLLRRRPHRRVFTEVPRGTGSPFLALRSSELVELDAQGRTVATATLEYVTPLLRSTSTIACALLARIEGRICIGLDDDDLPAAQCFVGNSELLVTPAWRIPHDRRSFAAARRFVFERIEGEYGCEIAESWDLGGPYYPSAGMSPEVVFPMAVEIVAESSGGRVLHWVPLEELVSDLDAMSDGHLRVLALRAAHALGLLGGLAGGAVG